MSADASEPKDKRVPVMMTASELKTVDDWSFGRRIRPRGEAIRQLVALGLKTSATENESGAPGLRATQEKGTT